MTKMDFETFENESDAIDLVQFFTSNEYVFAVASERVWGNPENREELEGDNVVYQLMPRVSDDGFFDWYCYDRPHNQFFKTKEMCVLYFIKFWTEWSRDGKLNWEELT